MNKSTAPFLAVAIYALSVLLAGQGVHAASAEDREAFTAAYGKYQELLAQNAPADELREVAKEVFDLGEEVFGPAHANTAALSLNYARTLEGEEALDALNESVQIYQDVFGDDAADLIDPYMEMARVTVSMGDRTAAREYYSQSLALLEKHLDPGSQLEGMMRMSIGIIDINTAVGPRQMKDHNEAALAMLNSAIEILQPLEGTQSKIYLAQSQLSLGNFEVRNQNYRDGIDSLLAAVTTFSEIGGNDLLTVDARIALVNAYETQGNRDEATEHLLAIAAVRNISSAEELEPVQAFAAYPRPSRENGRNSALPTTAEGFTVVSFTVDQEGFVVDPVVLESEGSNLFPGESLRAIRQFRYAPRLIDGEAVDTENVTHRFDHVPPPTRRTGR